MANTIAGVTSSTLGYWDNFYADRRSAAVPVVPSPFAQWVHNELGDPRSITELGFGTGRDSFWLADQGHRLTGFDGAHSAVEQATAYAAANGITARFAQLDLAETQQTLDAAEEVRGVAGAEVVYARFLLHSLTLDGRTNVLRFAAGALQPGGRLYVEFRTGQDARADHLFGDGHFREYLDAESVAHQMRELGGDVLYLEQGHGLAVYKSEDPHVARIVATWAQAG